MEQYVENVNILKQNLENLYTRYNRKRFIPPDPLQFVYRYSTRNDKELVAFLAAALAYGRVQQIQTSLTNLFSIMGQSPSDFTLTLGPTQKRLLKNFRHRFTSGADIADLLTLLKKVCTENQTLENYFAKGYTKDDKNILPALTTFCDSLLTAHAKKHKGNIPRGLKYLLCSPRNNSPCKRLNLFLRWMVRSDKVDTGLWRSIPPAALIIPMDAHISRITRTLKFHNNKNITLKTAVKVTEAFAELNPEDPVKYDFALCRTGMTADAQGYKKLSTLLLRE